MLQSYVTIRGLKRKRVRLVYSKRKFNATKLKPEGRVIQSDANRLIEIKGGDSNSINDSAARGI